MFGYVIDVLNYVGINSYPDKMISTLFNPAKDMKDETVSTKIVFVGRGSLMLSLICCGPLSTILGRYRL